MAKGVKKIKWVPREGDAKVFSQLSIPNKLLVIEPNKFAWFTIDEWEAGTTEIDKKKNITWIRQNSNRKIILAQKTIPSNKIYGVKLPKKLCGIYAYYIEASLSGKSDSRDVGLKVRGHCDAKIISSKWCATNDGSDQRSKQFKYGHLIYLNLETEGLNGVNNLIVDVYKIVEGGGGANDDKLVATYSNVQVIDGEVNLKMGNTSSWFVHARNDIEKFYVKVKAGNRYITDGKDAIHARFLQMKKDLVTPAFEPSTNQTPSKVGESGKNYERYEPCKFDAIKIKDVDADKKPVTITVFEGGKTKVEKANNPKETLHNTIYFDFDKDTVEANSKQLLSNILQFLLEHPFSTMKLGGYACVIGKQNYNNGLSKRRADAVKKFFADGKLDPSRIISIGYGEVNATDDKQGKDNIKYKNEQEYKTNRRVDIEFDYNGHAGQAVYETVAPSSSKNITIEVLGYDTKKCFKDKDPHKKGIKANATKYTTFKEVKGANTITIPIESDLSAFNVAPLQYIWPKYNLVKGATGNGLDSAVQYPVHIHSCRWFSENKSANLLIKAYPDIKWEFGLSFNWVHPFAYTHGNLPEYSRKNPKDTKVAEIIREERKAQSKAVGAGKESKRVANSPEMLTKFELKLEAKWGGQTFEISKELAEKIRAVLDIFIKYKEMADKVKNSLKGAPKGFLTKPPFMFEVQAPSLNANISWYLEQVTTGEHAGKVATVGTLNFKADPLIGASFTIDLLAVASRMHPAALAIVKGTELALSAVNGGITFEAIFSGKLSFDFKALEINSLTGVKAGKIDLGAEFKIKVVLKIQFEIVFESYVKDVVLKLRADVEGATYFTGKIEINSDEKGIYYTPEVGFSGLIFQFKVELMVGAFKRTVEYGNKDEPFLKPEPYKGDKHYFPLNNK